MTSEIVLTSIDARGLATVTLNRPEVHNAFDDALITALIQTCERLAHDPAVRIVLLTGAGASFSAGGDLNWMRRTGDYSYEKNFADAAELGRLMYLLDNLPKPTVARVHGAVFAGGIGLVACCDIAVADQESVFCISETRLGLVPAVISPYLVRAMGPRAARRYFLTAERFSAVEARRLGLVHEAVPAADLDATIARLVSAVLEGATGAQARSKRLIAEVAERPIEASVIDVTVRAIAEARASDEAREGLEAFFAKRKPRWR